MQPEPLMECTPMSSSSVPKTVPIEAFPWSPPVGSKPSDWLIVFNPKATLQHSLRRFPSQIIPKKSNGSKNTAFDPREMTPNHTDAAILIKLQQSSPLKQVDEPNLKTTPSMLNHSFLQWTAIHEEQERRKSFLQNFCEKFNRNSPPKMDLTEMVSRIYVEEAHKILYCEVPKAGCSNWKRTLMVLNGLAGSTDNISHDAVHYGRYLKKLDSFNETGIRERLRTFAKVIAVRDPVERLVSAFRDKFKQPNPYYHPVFGRAIIRKYRENATQEALQSGSGVTFTEFIRYLLDADRPVGMDIHWESTVLQHVHRGLKDTATDFSVTRLSVKYECPDRTIKAGNRPAPARLRGMTERAVLGELRSRRCLSSCNSERVMAAFKGILTQDFWRAVSAEFLATLIFVLLSLGSATNWPGGGTFRISLCFGLSIATMV
ncbi:hypothetical protein SKAU_G00074080 [Synaphobranchus kaupii]|uniref:Carbohydrate sulfotransferase n=1 Tax=Synaphobranchus kaupii TaxID=118154 RepID=A0A9Q1G869_SYNKA|nr:hypothetical protein SKAU_G00074080 [Synaphobranchus kaupii]